MARFSMTQEINAAPARVFEVFSDLENAPGRITGIKKLEVLTKGPVGKGTRFRETRIMFGKEATEEMEITDYVLGRRYSVGCRSCGCDYKFTFQFAPSGNGTRVDFETEARAVGFVAKLMSPLMGLMMGPIMKKCMTQDMTDLKTAIETH